MKAPLSDYIQEIDNIFERGKVRYHWNKLSFSTKLLCEPIMLDDITDFKRTSAELYNNDEEIEVIKFLHQIGTDVENYFKAVIRCDKTTKENRKAELIDNSPFIQLDSKICDEDTFVQFTDSFSKEDIGKIVTIINSFKEVEK
jgi:hypothetical protein